MNSIENKIIEIASSSKTRYDIWVSFLKLIKAKNIAEVGVFKGEFSAFLLNQCESIEKYYMIDPWCHIDDWNKPNNKDNNTFEDIYNEARVMTDFAINKRIILRGKTTEMVENIPNNILDFAYIDGDHTLKGISIDLIRIFPKIRVGGWIGGDDFSRTIWQHSSIYEPTLVFPFAVYFAEAVGIRIFALPHNQFLLEKTDIQQFSFIDFTGNYRDVSLLNQFNPNKILRLKFKEILFLLRNTIKNYRIIKYFHKKIFLR